MANESAHGYVTRAVRKGNKIELTIAVGDFSPGEAVEISGQVTQDNGAFATFYDIKNTPPAGGAGPPAGGASTAVGENGGDGPSVLVEAIPVDVSKFDLQSPITVVTRVARVWATVMNVGPTAKAWTAKDGIPVRAWPSR